MIVNIFPRWDPFGQIRVLANRLPGPASIWVIALVIGVVRFAFAGRYDAFRNELYFIVCGRHLDFGFVDQPPLIPALAAITQLFGDNVWLLRFPAVLAAIGLVPLTGLFAKLLGGDRTSAWIAGLAAGIAPGLIALTTTLGTSTFEPMAWTGVAYLLAVAIIRENERVLPWAGVIAGTALEAKYGIALWIVALVIGVATTSPRRLLVRKSFWVAALLATAIAAPSVLWQATHGWPFLELHLHRVASGANFTGAPLDFAYGQAVAMNVLLFPLWATGVIAPFFLQKVRAAQFLSVAFVAVAVATVAGHGKDYYLFPVYPTMFAVGSVVIADINPLLRNIWMGAATVVSLVLAPIALPILEPALLARYIARTHLAPPPEESAAVGAPLTQIFSDQLGWRSLEEQVANIYRSLPETEKQSVVILAANYGEAAALEVYGRKDNLPRVYCGENQYFLWGNGGPNESVIIHVNGDPGRWRRFCQSVEIAGEFGTPYVMPYENDRPIFICTGLRHPLSEIWNRLKRFE